VAKTPDHVARDVIDRYQAGERIADLAAATGVAMGTVYTILRRSSLQPVRQPRNRDKQRTERALALALDYLSEDERAEVLAVLNGDKGADVD
jgi:hypothetical protein